MSRQVPLYTTDENALVRPTADDLAFQILVRESRTRNVKQYATFFLCTFANFLARFGILPAGNRFDQVHVKLDRLGDFLIFLRSVPKQHFRSTDLLVASEETRQLVELAALPLKVKFIALERFQKDFFYRVKILSFFRSVSARKVFNYQLSRSPVLGDSIVSSITAEKKIGMRGDLSNRSHVRYLPSGRFYSDLITVPSQKRHETECIQDFVTQACAPYPPESPHDTVRKAIKFFPVPPFAPQEPFVLFSIDASDPTKQYPHLPRLIEDLAMDFESVNNPMRLVLTGQRTISQEKRMKDLSSFGRVLNLHGQTDLKEFLKLVDLCQLLVSNESFAGHVGELLSVPTLVLRWGVHWNRFFPYPHSTTGQVLPEVKNCDCNFRCRYSARTKTCSELCQLDPGAVKTKIHAMLGDDPSKGRAPS